MKTPKPIETPKSEPKPLRLAIEPLEERVAPTSISPIVLDPLRTAGWGC